MNKPNDEDVKRAKELFKKYEKSQRNLVWFVAELRAEKDFAIRNAVENERLRQKQLRPPVQWAKIPKLCSDLCHDVARRLDEHGSGIYAGNHEILGSMSEEWDEFKEAVHDNDSDKAMKELMDMNVVGIFGIASIQQRLEDKAREG